MAESKNSILLLDDGSGREVECYYRTSTENIIDFVQAVNNLIHTSQSDTVFSGTTTFENIHVTGTSQLDGEIMCGDNIIINENMNISDGGIYNHGNDIMINSNDKSYINLNRKGGWEIYSNKNVESTLSVDSETGVLSYDKKIDIGGGLKVSGTVDSPINFQYANINSDHLGTTISTTSGGRINIPNGNSAIQITTKSGKIFKIEDNGTAYIDGKQLLTKTELMQLEHPVGSAYITFTDTNPSTILGIGTWQKVGTGYKLGIVGAVNDRNGTSHTTVAGNNTDGEWAHGLTVAELAAHNHAASASGGAHTHSGSTSTNGNHCHGAMGENTSCGSGPYGYYDGNNSHAGSNGGVDWDNTLWNTSTNGNHSHSVTIGSSGAHGHTITLGNTGSGSRHNNIEPTFGIYLWKRTA